MPLMIIPPADAPVGYPFDFERSVILRDGSSAHIRPIVPSDAGLLADEIAIADEETLYLRFFTPVVRLDDERLRYLTELDYRHRFAIAAFAPDGTGIGIARYEGAVGSDEAEVAVTVKRGYRRAGLATVLFEVLEEAARAGGIRRFLANYLAENEAAEALMEASGYGVPVYDGGVATVSKDL